MAVEMENPPGPVRATTARVGATGGVVSIEFSALTVALARGGEGGAR